MTFEAFGGRENPKASYGAAGEVGPLPASSTRYMQARVHFVRSGGHNSVLVFIAVGIASQRWRGAEVSLHQGELLYLYLTREEGRRWDSVIET